MPTMIAATSSFDGIKDFINWICQPHLFMAMSVGGLAAFLIWYRQLTRPVVAGAIATVCVLFFAASALDPDFYAIITKADNVPIVMMLFAVGFFLWLAFRQAAINDENMEQGKPQACSPNRLVVRLVSVRLRQPPSTGPPRSVGERSEPVQAVLWWCRHKQIARWGLECLRQLWSRVSGAGDSRSDVCGPG